LTGRAFWRSLDERICRDSFAVSALISAAFPQPLFPPRSCRVPVVLALRFRTLFSPFFLPPLPETIRPFAL